MTESALFRPIFDVPSHDFHEAKKLWTTAVLLLELSDRSLRVPGCEYAHNIVCTGEGKKVNFALEQAMKAQRGVGELRLLDFLTTAL